jgi:hypothetical protein
MSATGLTRLDHIVQVARLFRSLLASCIGVNAQRSSRRQVPTEN